MHLEKLFKKHIKGTPKKAVVTDKDKKVLLCNLTNVVIEVIEMDGVAKSVYITSRCIKHLYDKKPAEEFDFIISNLHEIVKYPDKIYKNSPGKRGDFCFVKRIGNEIGNEEYLCSIEISEVAICTCGNIEVEVDKLGADSLIKEIQIATAMRIRKKKYIKNYTLLWDWGNDNPHRNALDASGKKSTNVPQ